MLTFLGTVELNASEKEHFKAVLFGRATTSQRNIVSRLLEKELRNNPDALKRLSKYRTFE